MTEYQLAYKLDDSGTYKLTSIASMNPDSFSIDLDIDALQAKDFQTFYIIAINTSVKKRAYL